MALDSDGTSEVPKNSNSAAAVPQTNWQEISERKIKQRQSLLDRWPEWRLKQPVPGSVTDVSTVPTSQLTPREYEIVHQDATSLVERLRSRQYTAVEVIKAFCHVAAVAQEVTNCLTEIMFDEGVKRAAELDRHLEEIGDVVGPLHGLPVSVKDHILVKNYDTSTGYIAWAFNTVATKDAMVIDILRKAGAVLYVKTANPQTLLVCFLNFAVKRNNKCPCSHSKRITTYMAGHVIPSIAVSKLT